MQFVDPVSRNSDLMQLVAEIAAYEDFVDEGNYNVVRASERCAEVFDGRKFEHFSCSP